MLVEQRLDRAKRTMTQGLPALGRSEEPSAPTLRGSRKAGVLLGALLAVAAGAAAGYSQWSATGEAGESEQGQPAARHVHVARPEPAAGREVTLPATLQPYQAADLYARSSGYLKAWKADIGDRVRTGQVLAEIDTPELDQELEQAVAVHQQGQAELEQARAELDETRAEVQQAEANLERAVANLDFAAGHTDRQRRLVSSRAVSREDYESSVRDRDGRKADQTAARADLNRRKTNLATREAVIRSREAGVNSRQANVQRLRELQGFKKVVAPFDGVVTGRNAEVGMLVAAGGKLLFRLAQTDVLRVQVQAPQTFAPELVTGSRAQVTVPEFPGRGFPAVVARTAGLVDPTTRTLLVELELPNRAGRLLPGVYGQVRFQAARSDGAVLIPANALMLKSDGPHVVAVRDDGSLQVRKVALGRDLGAKVEVPSGLSRDERLVMNPSDDLREGQQVEVDTSPPRLE